jgi:FkbM family methyltransferase
LINHDLTNMPTTQNRDSASQPESQKIPNQFIFVYGLHPKQEAFHLIHYLCLNSCRVVNKPDRIILCSPQEPFGYYWDLIKPYIEHHVVSEVPQVSNFEYENESITPYRYAHHSDYIRLEQLLRHGGVYADLDTLFVNPIPTELFYHSFVLGKEQDIVDPKTGLPAPSLCNAVIMSAPDSAFCQRWLDAMDDAFDGTWSNHSTLLPQRLSSQYPEEIHIEPERSFFHFQSTNEGLSLLFDSITDIPVDTYNIHLWAHLWWSDLRIDFSSFDASRVTEDFVHEVDTTYNLAARPFLPKSRYPHFIQYIQRKSKSVIATATRKYQQYRNVSRAKQHLTDILAQQRNDDSLAPLILSAHRELLYYKACKSLDIANGFEEAIIHNVLLGDEYRLANRQFKSTDVIIDVGCHLGVFSLLCHHLGSRKIYGFEPDTNNFNRLSKLLGGYRGVQLSSKAVFRSDWDKDEIELVHSGPQGANSGAGNVIMQGYKFAIANQQAWLLPEQTSTVNTTKLDSILSQHERIALLKLDCEGSEFPILLTSRELGRVDEIIGEYHEITPKLMPQLDSNAQVGRLTSYTIGLLGARLQAFGFEFTFSRSAINMGNFHAIRR